MPAMLRLTATAVPPKEGDCPRRTRSSMSLSTPSSWRLNTIVMKFARTCSSLASMARVSCQ
jgi:hypothetical protein